MFGGKFKEKSAKVGHHKVELMIVNHEKLDRYSSIEDFVIKTLLDGASTPAAEVYPVVDIPYRVCLVGSSFGYTRRGHL